jgi:hypothetical protein
MRSGNRTSQISVVIVAIAMLLWGLARLLSPPASAAAADSIVGTWRLQSLVREVVATGQRQDTLGEKPDGYLAYSPDGRMYVIITQSNRLKPAGLVATNEERVKLYDTTFAYAGAYRIDGDKVVHRIDISWNQQWTGAEQVRDFRLVGDTLTITTPVFKSTVDGQDIRTVAIWKKIR